MAAPLFVDDTETLKKELRLSGVDVDTDADDIIRNATGQVRMQILSRIPSATVTTLLATTYTPTPAHTDTAAIKRTMAYLLEVKWVRLVLMNTLPSMFMDNSGGIQEVWNEEGAFRKRLPEDLVREKREAMVTIETWLEILNGQQTLGAVETSRMFTTRRQNPTASPTGSLSGGNDVLFGDPSKVDKNTPGVD